MLFDLVLEIKQAAAVVSQGEGPFLEFTPLSVSSL